MQRLIKKAKAGQHGFTLVELMIVVAIVGVLAVLAVYGVRKYIANAKTAEARNSLGQIGKDASTSYEKESFTSATVLAQGSATTVLRKLCGSATKTVPAASSSVSGTKYQSSPADWTAAGADATSNVGFPCLKFSMDQPQYYTYGYVTTGTGGGVGDSFSATAKGDLNGDNSFSTFTLIGAVGSGYVLNVAPTIQEASPEE